MRIFFNIFLVLVAIALAFMLYKNIEEPIEFNKDYTERKRTVQEKLTKIRSAQELYRDITGNFAPSFDTLSEVLQTGRFMLVNVQGDPDDPNFAGQITYDTSYLSAADSVASLGWDLSQLRYVPYTDNSVEFDIAADTITYQSTPNVAVVQVGTRYENFMGKYDISYSRYDAKYDPRKTIKFGDLEKPNLSGNWEN